MKLIIKMIMATMLLCLPFGVDAQDATRHTKSKNQQAMPTTPIASKQTKEDEQLTPSEMCDKGYETYKRGEHSEAVRWYRKAADQGLAEAQCELAYMYRDGYGVAEDYSEAVRWFRKAAEQGLSEAQIWLGIMYEEGLGVVKDYSEAVKWYRKTAEEGNSGGQYRLGMMYEKGLGVVKDLNEAMYWYQKATSQGHWLAIKAFERLIGK